MRLTAENLSRGLICEWKMSKQRQPVKLLFPDVWYWNKGKAWSSGWRGLCRQPRGFTTLSDTSSVLGKAEAELGARSARVILAAS